MDSELHDLLLSELDRLYRFAYNRTGNAYKAEDITQDIILTAIRSYPKIQDRSRIIPWLWGIARNVYLRSLQPSGEIAIDEVIITDISGATYETPETEYLEKEDTVKVRRAVSYLSKTYRDVCVMHFLENKDYKAIAEELDIPLSSVKWRLNQSKVQLREELEKMDSMENGYRKAKKLRFRMGGYVDKKYDPALGIMYDNADKALDGLLPQNICIEAYEKPKTVTEIASALGVSADYIEESLGKLVKTQSVKQTGNRYQTMFPIWDEAAFTNIFGSNFAAAKEHAGDIIEAIYSLSDEIKTSGFLGCDKPMDKLILFLIGFVALHTENNKFETDKLPFRGFEKAWYILGTTDESFGSDRYNGNGINSSGSMFGLREYFFVQKIFKDHRSETKEQKAFYSLYLQEPVEDDYSLSRLIQDGKIVISMTGDPFRIAVPVVSEERGEIKNLIAILAPVFEKTNALQDKIYKRSLDTVKKHIPKHMAGCIDFFGSYCSHDILITALFDEWMTRNIELTSDMVTWYTVK